MKNKTSILLFNAIADFANKFTVKSTNLIAFTDIFGFD